MSDTPSTTSVSAPTSPTLNKRTLDIREFAGNAKRITVECNRQHLRISGNGNKVFVACNAGKLEVLGNGNRIKILDNTAGKVNIVGNNTKIYLSSESVMGKSHTNVKFTGLNGAVKLVSSEELRKTKSQPTSPTSTKHTIDDCVKIPVDQLATSKTAPSCNDHFRQSTDQSSASDELLRQFDHRFCSITDYGLAVNNINVSLDNLPTTSSHHIHYSSRSSIHIGTCQDVRLTAAKSSLVINHSS